MNNVSNKLNGPLIDYFQDPGDWERNKVVKGIVRYPNGTEYRGDIYRDVPHGYGIKMSIDGSYYKGNFRFGQRHGQGTYVRGNDIYTGEWSKNQNGYGKRKYADGSTYEGGWVNGLRHGEGTYTLPNGRKIVSVWENGAPKREDSLTELHVPAPTTSTSRVQSLFRRVFCLSS